MSYSPMPVAAPGDAAPTKRLVIMEVGTDGVPTPVADGQAIQRWLDLYGREIDYATDLSQAAKRIVDLAPVSMIPYNETVVDAKNADFTSAPIPMSRLARKTFFIDVTWVSGTVDVIFWGSWDGINFDYELDNTTYVASANDIYTLNTHMPFVQVELDNWAGDVTTSVQATGRGQ